MMEIPIEIIESNISIEYDSNLLSWRSDLIKSIEDLLINLTLIKRSTEARLLEGELVLVKTLVEEGILRCGDEFRPSISSIFLDSKNLINDRSR